METGIEQPVSTSWHSYTKSLALGHRLLHELFFDEVTVEEKIDGSQFSFGSFNGELKVRSKSCVMNVEAPEKMFTKGVELAKELHAAGLLRDGWTYRGEFLAKPKHNALAYDRFPDRHFIGFDINDGHESYLNYEEKAAEFARLGLETVPLLFKGTVDSIQFFRTFLEHVSVLGGQKIEGVVVKNYKRFGPDHKVLMGKFVSEAFKETHAKVWKDENPKSGDIIDRLAEVYTSQARWTKAMQHAREAGALENSPRDIGLLVKMIPDDVRAECEDEIKQRLFDWAWPQFARQVIRGFPQYYKEQLLRLAFEDDDAASEPPLAPEESAESALTPQPC